VDAPAEIWLKLENLQPIGSFKLRGAANAVLDAPADALTNGLVTTSMGNMAQGVAWMARELGIPATIVAPGKVRLRVVPAREQGREATEDAGRRTEAKDPVPQHQTVFTRRSELRVQLRSAFDVAERLAQLA